MRLQAVRTTLMTILAMSMAGGILFTGCGDVGESAAAPAKEAAETKETAEGQSEETAEAEPTKEELEAQEAAQDEADRAQLQAFLDGSEPVFFQQVNVTYYADGGEAKIFEEGRGYTLEEFRSAFYDCKIIDAGYTEEGMPEESQMTVSYGWIEVQGTGCPALAILFEGVPFGGETMQDLWIVKPVDGQLQVLYNAEYGYRSNAEVNTYGVIHYGGSGGAAIHYDETYMITREGTCELVVSEEQDLDAWSFYLPEDLCDTEEDKEALMDSVRDLVVLQYHFDPAPAYSGDEDLSDAFREWYENGIYTCYRRNDSFDFLEDVAIYDEGTPYRAFMDHYKVSFVKPNEAKDLIEARKEAIGFQDAWEEMPELSFTSLTGE